MSTFGKRLKHLREEQSISQIDLAEMLKVSKSTISMYENDNREPGFETLESIADIFNVDIDYLMCRTDIKNYLNLSRLYSHNISDITYTKIPLLGTIAAGTPILAEENIEQYFTIDKCIKADFALKVKGDSMIDANILNGDIVFIRQQPTLETGEIGAFIIDDEATLKRYYKDGNKIILQPDNRNYMPIIITGGDVRIAGKLVAILNIKD